MNKMELVKRANEYMESLRHGEFGIGDIGGSAEDLMCGYVTEDEPEAIQESKMDLLHTAFEQVLIDFIMSQEDL